MNHILRTSLALGVLALAAASQALTLNYVGQGALNGTTTTAVTGGAPDDFGFTSSTTSLNTIVLSKNGGVDTLTFTVPGLTTTAVFFSGLATSVIGTGAFAGDTLATAAATQLDLTGLTVAVQGTINPVPEPASMAALAIGGLGLLRVRRRKA